MFCRINNVRLLSLKSRGLSHHPSKQPKHLFAKRLAYKCLNEIFLSCPSLQESNCVTSWRARRENVQTGLGPRVYIISATWKRRPRYKYLDRCFQQNKLHMWLLTTTQEKGLTSWLVYCRLQHLKQKLPVRRGRVPTQIINRSWPCTSRRPRVRRARCTCCVMLLKWLYIEGRGFNSGCTTGVTA